MSWVTWAAIYFTVWWTVLFAILPFGVKREENPATGHEPGAPARAMILRKFFWTSIVSAILVGGAWVAVKSGLLDWRALMQA